MSRPPDPAQDPAPPLAAHLSEARLGELADGTLGAAERERAQRHAAECAACRQALAEARALLVMARAARGGVTAPPELWPLVAASTVHAARLRRRTVRSMRGVLALVAVALVLGTAAATALVTAWLRPPPSEETRRAVDGVLQEMRRLQERHEAEWREAELRREQDRQRMDRERVEHDRREHPTSDRLSDGTERVPRAPSAPRPPSAPRAPVPDR